MYAKTGNEVILVELIIEKPESGSLFEFIITVKGNDVLLIKQFAIYLKENIKKMFNN